MDTTTEEGRAAFKAEYEALAELAPEMIKKEDMVFPHEMAPQISSEPHFQRVWKHYRSHALKSAICAAIDDGAITAEDASLSSNFLGMTSKTEGVPSVTLYCLAK